MFNENFENKYNKVNTAVEMPQCYQTVSSFPETVTHTCTVC